MESTVQETNQNINGQTKEADTENKQEDFEIVNHPNATNVDSGDVNDAIRNWHRKKKEVAKEDQQIQGDQRVKKPRQQ